jgi:hypothetical protein
MPWHRPCNAGERFWDNVLVIPNGCFLWTGYTNSLGYGRFRGLRGSKGKVLAHRFSYELRHGPIPDGLVLDHLCRNPSRVRPDHLEPVTQRENAARGLPNQFVNRSTCQAGHEWTPENTRRDESGRRVCRACMRRWQIASRRRRDGQLEMAGVK